MKKALLLSLRNSDFTEMFRLACALKQSGEYNPLILSYTKAIKDISFQKARCDTAGISLRLTDESKIGELNKNRSDESRKRFLFEIFFRTHMNYLVEATLFTIRFLKRCKSLALSIMRYLFLFNAQMAQHRKTIQDFAPDILIIAEDIVGLTLPAFIKIGHERNIPTVIVPYTIANAIEAAESLHVYPNYQVRGIIAKFIAWFCPRWIYTYKGIRLFRLPTCYIVAHALFRLTPPDPWTMNSGYANAIAIESTRMKNYYLNENFIEEKLIVTGAIYDDTLAKFFKDKSSSLIKLYDALGLPQGKPLLVVGAPPNQLATPRPSCPYRTYDEVMDNLAKALAPYRADWNIVIRPHPNFMDIEHHFTPYGLSVTDRDTAELIPLSDIYLAYASATIRWAVSCGIPAINYDLFQYGYDDYKPAPGVLHVYTPSEFEATLEKLIHDKNFYEETQKAQRAVMHDWGHTDGLSTTRMIALFNKVIAQKPTPRTPTTQIRHQTSD